MSHAVFFNPAILRVISKSRLSCTNLPVVSFLSTWKPDVPDSKVSSLKSSPGLHNKHTDKQHNRETSRSQNDLYQTQVTQKYRHYDQNYNLYKGKKNFGNSDQDMDRFGHKKSFNAERSGGWVDHRQEDPVWLVKIHHQLMKDVTLPPSYKGQLLVYNQLLLYFLKFLSL